MGDERQERAADAHDEAEEAGWHSERRPAVEPGDISGDPEPHHALSNPAQEPDPTEWPDPYEEREDPRYPVDAPGDPAAAREAHPQTGAETTSDPHPSQDPEAAERWEAPKRDKLDQ
jgi:hypothetical protein